VNCNLEFFPEKALAQAKELDEYLEKHKKPVGPLHGLPVSLKDQFRIKVPVYALGDTLEQRHLTNSRDWKPPWDMCRG
jgi:Asp-tRNA(Asn)/Glu-tRNA(Gln) amidotransferase A subunit family amidase